jgi:hypothetical protein
LPSWLFFCYAAHKGFPARKAARTNLWPHMRIFMNVDLYRRTNEVLSRLTQLRDSL